MLWGMGGVFFFLLLLMGYMKIVPILSRFRRSNQPSTDQQETSSAPRKQEKKLKLNSVLHQISEKDSDHATEPEIAAIAAAVFSLTGKKPKKLVITSPSGSTGSYNLWGVAGRQDIMQARDVTGQVGFQY